VENKFQLRVDGPEWIQPSDRLRNRKRRAVREVNGYGVGEVADPAMLLVFELIVPVAGGLESKRQYECSDYNCHNPICRSLAHAGSKYLAKDIT